MSLASKIAAGIATTGAVGGALALGSYSLINTQNIQGRLKEEGYEPLDITKTGGDWDTVMKAHNLATTNKFKNSPASGETEATLKIKCKNALNDASNNKENYLLARQWCVKERTAKDILDKLKLRELKTEPTPGTGGSSNNTDDATWINKANKYKNDKFKNQITISPTTEKNNVDKEAIKKACKALEIANLKTTTDKFNEKLEQIKEWCVIEEVSPS